MTVGYGESDRSQSAIVTHDQRVDHVDMKALAKRGIRLGNTPDVLTEAGEQLEFSLLDVHSSNAPRLFFSR